MNGFIIRFLILCLFLLPLDWYAWQAIKTLFEKSKVLPYVYWFVSISTLGYMLMGMINREAVSAKTMGVFLVSFYTSKILLIAFMLGEDIYRIVYGSVRRIVGNAEDTSFLPDRRKFVSQIAVVIASINVGSIIFGAVKGRYNYKVHHATLEFDDLPESFDGFTITQISDIHSGSFSDPEEVLTGIRLANEQKSDVMFFTGDLVNNRADEMEPWVEHFSQLEAPYGKFSTMGNHDYGDFYKWPSKEEKRANLQKLKDTHKEIGFQLLDNDSIRLEKDGQHINILGVENWGLPPFPQKGDLAKAAEKCGDKEFNVLLSHDPTHWTEKVIDYHKKIHLTLSGHTHGMQFGIEIPGWFKFSPVQFKYKNWAGLYEKKDQYLYVNRGFGYLGYHGRVGIWPEVTVITLRKKQMV